MKTISDVRELLDSQSGTPTYRDRRIRTLSQGFEEQFWKVAGAIGTNAGLSARMYECGDVDAHNNMKLCGIPQCPRCFMTRRGKETAKAIKKFGDASNERLVFLTLLLPVTTRTSELNDLLKKEKRRIINLIDRKRRGDARWGDVHMTGFWEMDRIAAGQIENLGRNKRIALEQLGAPAVYDSRTTVWVPHLHAVVDRGAISIEELKEAFRADGRRGAYRVNAKTFQPQRTVAENLKTVVRYSMKFRLEDDYKRGSGLEVLDDGLLGDDQLGRERQWWSQEDIRAYVEWASKRTFRSMRFEIGKKDINKSSFAGTTENSFKKKDDRSVEENSIFSAPDMKDFVSTRSGFQWSLEGLCPCWINDVYGLELCRYKEPLHDTNWLRAHDDVFGLNVFPDDALPMSPRICGCTVSAGTASTALTELHTARSLPRQ